MSEEVETGVEEVVAAAPESEAEQPIQETATAESQSPPKPKGKDENMARMRQSLDDLAKQNRELQFALEQFQKVKQPEPAPQPDELDSMAADDLVSKSQTEKLIERRVKAQVEAALKAVKLEVREGAFAASNTDYGQVVNEDNFKALFEDVPELQPVLKRAYELAQKGEDIDPVALSYKLLKRVGFGAKGEPSEMAKKTVEQLNKNQQKPLSSNAIKSSGLSEAHSYMNRPSSEEKKRIFKETQEAARARR